MGRRSPDRCARRAVAAAVCLAAIHSLSAAGTQSTPTERPAFAVASVKEHRNGASVRTAYSETPDGVTLQNVTAMRLILWAFGGVNRDVVGGPDWIRSRRFDVAAKTGAPVQRATDLRTMMQGLLEERFGLQAAHERMDRPVYALVLAREGRIGPALSPAESTCERRPEFVARENLGKMFCGIDMASDANGVQLVLGSHATMTQLAHGLSRAPLFDRPIVDRTGLTGEFDFVVNASRRMALNTTATTPAPGFEFMTALEVQLGLKLQPTWASIDVLVIHAIRLPTEN